MSNNSAQDKTEEDGRGLEGRISSRCETACAAFAVFPCGVFEDYCVYGYDETYEGTWD